MDLERYFDKIYEEYDRYLAVPVALLVLSLGILGVQYVQTGKFFQKGPDFSGGTEVKYSLQQEFTTTEIENVFARQGRPGVTALKQTSGGDTTLLVQIPPPNINSTAEAEQFLEEAGYNVTVKGFNSISASVSQAFFFQAQMAFVLAFTVMSLVIFVAFKDIIPSLAVIFAATGDLVFAGAMMALFDIPLTLGSMAALLMLIGYSVDTDIVLSSRVLKQDRGTLKERIWSSVKTGVTMSSGGIAGFTLLYLVSYAIVGPSELSTISAVMVIGLLADIPFTWFGNAVILKKHVHGEIPVEKVLEVVPWT
ncbi:MAG: protein translocase subunit SecF [Candidatus Nanohaloarchaea archaeon]